MEVPEEGASPSSGTADHARPASTRHRGGAGHGRGKRRWSDRFRSTLPVTPALWAGHARNGPYRGRVEAGTAPQGSGRRFADPARSAPGPQNGRAVMVRTMLVAAAACV